MCLLDMYNVFKIHRSVLMQFLVYCCLYKMKELLLFPIYCEQYPIFPHSVMYLLPGKQRRITKIIKKGIDVLPDSQNYVYDKRKWHGNCKENLLFFSLGSEYLTCFLYSDLAHHL